MFSEWAGNPGPWTQLQLGSHPDTHGSKTQRSLSRQHFWDRANRCSKVKPAKKSLLMLAPTITVYSILFYPKHKSSYNAATVELDRTHQRKIILSLKEKQIFYASTPGIVRTGDIMILGYLSNCTATQFFNVISKEALRELFKMTKIKKSFSDLTFRFWWPKVKE